MQAPNAPRSSSRKCQQCGQQRNMKLSDFLMKSGGVKAKYLSYTPEDVEEIDDLDTLRWLYDKYKLPASQPQTVEEATYQCLMTYHLGIKIKQIEKIFAL